MPGGADPGGFVLWVMFVINVLILVLFQPWPRSARAVILIALNAIPVALYVSVVCGGPELPAAHRCATVPARSIAVVAVAVVAALWLVPAKPLRDPRTQ